MQGTDPNDCIAAIMVGVLSRQDVRRGRKDCSLKGSFCTQCRTPPPRIGLGRMGPLTHQPNCSGDYGHEHKAPDHKLTPAPFRFAIGGRFRMGHDNFTPDIHAAR